MTRINTARKGHPLRVLGHAQDGKAKHGNSRSHRHSENPSCGFLPGELCPKKHSRHRKHHHHKRSHSHGEKREVIEDIATTLLSPATPLSDVQPTLLPRQDQEQPKHEKHHHNPTNPHTAMSKSKNPARTHTIHNHAHTATSTNSATKSTSSPLTNSTNSTSSSTAGLIFLIIVLISVVGIIIGITFYCRRRRRARKELREQGQIQQQQQQQQQQIRQVQRRGTSGHPFPRAPPKRYAPAAPVHGNVGQTADMGVGGGGMAGGYGGGDERRMSVSEVDSALDEPNPYGYGGRNLRSVSPVHDRY